MDAESERQDRNREASEQLVEMQVALATERRFNLTNDDEDW